MGLNINLASQKFEDVRQFYVRWSVAIGFAALLLVLLIGLAWINFAGSSKSRQRIQQFQAEIDDLQKERAPPEAISNIPEKHDITDQKNYWNKQIHPRQ